MSINVIYIQHPKVRNCLHGTKPQTWVNGRIHMNDAVYRKYVHHYLCSYFLHIICMKVIRIHYRNSLIPLISYSLPVMGDLSTLKSRSDILNFSHISLHTNFPPSTDEKPYVFIATFFLKHSQAGINEMGMQSSMEMSTYNTSGD